ncbi:putative E3 ubiquitin-protein ligase herc3 [Perkinsus olseni]|uniref:Putative E3 ubiquitin-protein ligase herc3 n=1 Tax=Perkinsus olseni TaxID=32597 RepID=A0A7J6M9Z6_PEROL|nr:putative E3 ubiquitin-protein ligase herc3 [Perkinsus olseni]
MSSTDDSSPEGSSSSEIILSESSDALGSPVEDSVGVYCWGDNWCGQCLAENEQDKSTVERPQRVCELDQRRPKSLCTGPESTLVVSESGRIYGGGHNEKGYITGPDGDDSENLFKPRLVAYQELEQSFVTAVNCGDHHTVALTSNNLAISWGRDNEFGQVGHGQPSINLMPPRMMVTPQEVCQVACGSDFTLLLLETGEVFGTGNNSVGQLGTGNTEAIAAPKPVLNCGQTYGVPIRQISAGDSHACAVSISGVLFTWGSNRKGQLGREDAGHHELLPGPVSCLPPAKAVQMASCGAQHTAAVLQGGQAYLWGDNASGQCGVDPAEEPTLPIPLNLQSKEVWRAVACGGQHTLFLDVNGKLFGCGSNESGQLGTGVPGRSSELRPTLMPRSLAVFSVAAGRSHSAVLAIKSAERPMVPRVKTSVPTDLSAPGLFKAHSMAFPKDDRMAASARPATVDPGDGSALRKQRRMLSTPVEGVISEPAGESGGLKRTDNAERLAGHMRGASQKSATVSEATSLMSDTSGGSISHNLPKTISGGSKDYLAQKAGGRISLTRSTRDGVIHAMLHQVVTPGVGSTSFAALSAESLQRMVRTFTSSSSTSTSSDDYITNVASDLKRSLLAIFRTQDGIQILNSSLLYPGHRKSVLDTQTAYACFTELWGSEAFQKSNFEQELALVVRDSLRDMSGKSLETEDQLRGVLTIMLLPLMDRPVGTWCRQRMGELIACLSPKGKLALVDLIANECPQHYILSGCLIKTWINQANSLANEVHNLGGGKMAVLSQAMIVLTIIVCAAEKVGLPGADEITVTGLVDAIPPDVEFMMYSQTWAKEYLKPDPHGGRPIGRLPSKLEVLAKPECVGTNTTTVTEYMASMLGYGSLVPLAFKNKVLQMENVLRQVKHNQEHLQAHPGIMVDAFMRGVRPKTVLQVQVRRDHIVEDALRVVAEADDQQLKFPMMVKFEGEDGVDEGGVQREFFDILCKQLFNAQYGMFEYLPDSRVTWINPNSVESPENFQHVGTLIGLLVYNNLPGLGVPFPRVLFKRLLQGSTAELTFEDLEEVFPEEARSLQHLLEYEPKDPQHADEEVKDTFCIFFNVSYDYYGESRNHDLIPDGSNVPVTYSNREQFVREYIQWKLVDSIKAHYDPFEKGFYRVLGDSLTLCTLTPVDLHAILCGEQKLDFDALRKSARYEGAPFKEDYPYIQAFWKIVSDFNDTQASSDETPGSDRVPLGGLGSIRMIVQKNGGEPTVRLPTAYTCYDVLLLPEYSSPDKLKKMLLAAIENSEGFGLQSLAGKSKQRTAIREDARVVVRRRTLSSGGDPSDKTRSRALTSLGRLESNEVSERLRSIFGDALAPPISPRPHRRLRRASSSLSADEGRQDTDFAPVLPDPLRHSSSPWSFNMDEWETEECSVGSEHALSKGDTECDSDTGESSVVSVDAADLTAVLLDRSIIREQHIKKVILDVFSERVDIYAEVNATEDAPPVRASDVLLRFYDDVKMIYEQLPADDIGSPEVEDGITEFCANLWLAFDPNAQDVRRRCRVVVISARDIVVTEKQSTLNPAWQLLPLRTRLALSHSPTRWADIPYSAMGRDNLWKGLGQPMNRLSLQFYKSAKLEKGFQVNHSLHSDRLGVMWTTVLVLFVLVVTWFRYRLLMATAGSFYYCSDDTEKTMTILKYAATEPLMMFALVGILEIIVCLSLRGRRSILLDFFDDLQACYSLLAACLTLLWMHLGPKVMDWYCWPPDHTYTLALTYILSSAAFSLRWTQYVFVSLAITACAIILHLLPSNSREGQVPTLSILPTATFYVVVVTCVFLLTIYKYVYEGVLREDFVLHLSLAKEASRCNALLTNVLPERILDTLKERQDAVDSMEGVRRDSGLVLSREIGITEAIKDVTIMFSDIPGFTALSMKISPREIVLTLNELFSLFDELAQEEGLSKIKTDGNNYMAAAGLPQSNMIHAPAVCRMALRMMDEVARRNADITLKSQGSSYAAEYWDTIHEVDTGAIQYIYENSPTLESRSSGQASSSGASDPPSSASGDAESPVFVGIPVPLRVGIDSGDCMGGVIGRKKFIYDVWGDCVNTASRMVQYGEIGCTQITDSTKKWLDVLAPGCFETESRGVHDVKGKGPMLTHFLLDEIKDYKAVIRELPEPSESSSSVRRRLL